MKRILSGVVVVAVMVLAPAATAGAKHRVLATPKNVCSALIAFGAVDYAGLGQCAGHLRRDLNAFRFPSDEDPSVLLSLAERCAGFEAEFLTYPFLFEEPEGWPFPTYTAQNRRQCENTLYAYHLLANTLGPPPGA